MTLTKLQRSDSPSWNASCDGKDKISQVKSQFKVVWFCEITCICKPTYFTSNCLHIQPPVKKMCCWSAVTCQTIVCPALSSLENVSLFMGQIPALPSSGVFKTQWGKDVACKQLKYGHRLMAM